MFADVSLFANGFSVTPTLRKSFLFFSPDHEPSALTVVVERSLLSLLFIPLLALVFLLVWKVRRTLTPATKLFNYCRYGWQPILLLVDISLFHGIYNPPEMAFHLSADAVQDVLIWVVVIWAGTDISTPRTGQITENWGGSWTESWGRWTLYRNRRDCASSRCRNIGKVSRSSDLFVFEQGAVPLYVTHCVFTCLVPVQSCSIPDDCRQWERLEF